MASDAATGLPVDTFDRKLRTLIDHARADHGMTRLQQQRARSSLKMWTDLDGMGHLHVTADPERFAHIQTAIEAETASLAATAKNSSTDCSNDTPVTLGPALQLDALVALLSGGCGPAGWPSITVVVDQATLAAGPHRRTVCETDNGIPLPAPVVERYLCDAVVRRVTLDDAGLPVNVGRRYRTATKAQWTALTSLYATCAWAQCGRPITWTQAHHIHEWERGGSTELDNLIPLCTRHHHMVHDHGWRLVLRPDRTLEIHRPASRHRAPSSGHPSPGHSPPGHPPNGSPPDQPLPAEPLPARPSSRLGLDSLWATTTPDRTNVMRGA